MKSDLLELIHLTELHIYENYEFTRSKSSVPEVREENFKPSIIAKPVAPKPEPVKAESELKKPTPIEPSLQHNKTEPIDKPNLLDLKEIEKLFSKELGFIKILKTPLDDTKAQEKAEEWKTSSREIKFLIIATRQQDLKELAFLQNLSDVINCYTSSKIAFEEDVSLYPSLKGIISSKDQQEFLKIENIPLLQIESIRSYFNNRKAKEQLARSLRNFLSN